MDEQTKDPLKGLTTQHRAKLAKAIAYLRERKIYVTEFNFHPTSAAATDVAQTVARYRAQTGDKKTLIRGVK